MSVSVMVLNMRGQPLMPTTPQKARRLLKEKRAKAIQRLPFMIQLRYASGENKQEVELGVDPGYSQSGFSAITAKKELLAAEIHFRMDVSQKLTERRNLRKPVSEANYFFFFRDTIPNRPNPIIPAKISNRVDSVSVLVLA